MFNKAMLQRAHDEIESTISAMSTPYTSEEFIDAFSSTYPSIYADFVNIYVARGYGVPHAMQHAHVQLMHTVNTKFSHLTRKVRNIPNPKGGDMSEWVRY